MASMEIIQLIERCRQGDTTALGELYQTYAKQMKGVCRRYRLDEQSVNDVLHDSFVIIYTSLDKLRDNSKAQAWMMSITRNVASKYKDYQKSHRTVSLDGLGSNNLLDEDTLEKEFTGLSLAELTALINKLPEGYGKIFRLAVFEGLSHKEIAAMLNIKPHSSSSQLARAKSMLRTMIQKSWPVLLLLIIPIAFHFLKNDNPIVDEEMPVATEQEETKNAEPTEQTQEPMIVHQPTQDRIVSPRKTKPMVDKIIEPVISDTLTDVAQETITVDTLHDNQLRDTVQFSPKMETPYYDLADIFPDKSVISGDKTKTHKWSLGVAYVGSFNEQTITGMSYGVEDADFSEPLPHKEDYVEDEILHNDTKPISLALMVRYKQSKRFALESGVSYIRRISEFKTTTNVNFLYTQSQTIHYLGIPVKGIYNMATGKRWSLYGNLGMTMGVPIHSQTYIVNIRRSKAKNLTVTNRPATWLWLPSAGLGIQYNITRNIGLYTEPIVQYHIPTRYSIKHPFSVSLPLGIKFIW